MIGITPNTINKRQAFFVKYELNDEVFIDDSAAKYNYKVGSIIDIKVKGKFTHEDLSEL